MKNMTPCRNGVDASIGTTRRRIPANGTPRPELICDSMMRPEFGIGLDKISPIFPPKRPPTEVATEKTPRSMAVVGCEKPVSSSHMGTKASAAQGKVPATPWATMIWNVRILHTCFASTSMALRPSNIPFNPFSPLLSHKNPPPICQDLQRAYALSVFMHFRSEIFSSLFFQAIDLAPHYPIGPIHQPIKLSCKVKLCGD